MRSFPRWLPEKHVLFLVAFLALVAMCAPQDMCAPLTQLQGIVQNSISVLGLAGIFSLGMMVRKVRGSGFGMALRRGILWAIVAMLAIVVIENTGL